MESTESKTKKVLTVEQVSEIIQGRLDVNRVKLDTYYSKSVGSGVSVEDACALRAEQKVLRELSEELDAVSDAI